MSCSKLKKGGIDKAGGKQEDQINIVCLCALENGSFVYKGPLFGCQFMNGR